MAGLWLKDVDAVKGSRENGFWIGKQSGWQMYHYKDVNKVATTSFGGEFRDTGEQDSRESQKEHPRRWART